MIFLREEDIPKNLKPYYSDYFESSIYRIDKYKSFERKYKNYLKKFCVENGYNLVDFHSMYFEFSCFIEKDGKIVYLSIPDVRYEQNGWANNILVRTAKHTHDFHGGAHFFTSFTELKEKINYLFNTWRY